MNYPEHEKLQEVKEKSQELGFFLEWLQHKYTLCEWEEKENYYDENGKFLEQKIEGYYPQWPKIELILADYFGIDYDKLMDEKDRMMKDIYATQ